MPGREGKIIGARYEQFHRCVDVAGTNPGDKGLQNTVTDDDVKSQRAAQGNSDFSVLFGDEQTDCQKNPDGARITQRCDEGHQHIQPCCPKMVIYKVENRKINGLHPGSHPLFLLSELFSAVHEKKDTHNDNERDSDGHCQYQGVVQVGGGNHMDRKGI